MVTVTANFGESIQMIFKMVIADRPNMDSEGVTVDAKIW